MPDIFPFRAAEARDIGAEAPYAALRDRVEQGLRSAATAGAASYEVNDHTHGMAGAWITDYIRGFETPGAMAVNRLTHALRAAAFQTRIEHIPTSPLRTSAQVLTISW